MAETADVLVVGAGLAGLVSGPRPGRRPGERCLLLEARDRVGGRVVNEEIGDGKIVEMGGQWAGPTQDKLLELAADLNVADLPDVRHGQEGAALQRQARHLRRCDPADQPAGAR